MGVRCRKACRHAYHIWDEEILIFVIVWTTTPCLKTPDIIDMSHREPDYYLTIAQDFQPKSRHEANTRSFFIILLYQHLKRSSRLHFVTSTAPLSTIKTKFSSFVVSAWASKLSMASAVIMSTKAFFTAFTNVYFEATNPVNRHWSKAPCCWKHGIVCKGRRAASHAL